MSPTKIAINGFGRIGRIFFRQAFGRPEFEIVAINDLGDPENMAYLLKYDSVYGRYNKSVEFKDGNLVVAGTPVKVIQEKDPAKLPWGQLGIDIVVEATGVFESYDQAMPHVTAGAKRVVLTAPPKDENTPTSTPGVGEETLASSPITSNASCTTNATNPVIAIMHEALGIEKAMMTTVHAYTATQGLVDGPDKKGDFRRARAAAMNIVPSTTGAAKTTTRVITELKDKFDGIAIRVPVVAGSLIDLTFVAKRATTAEEVNDIFRAACRSEKWRGIISYTEDQVVSTDILKTEFGSIVDLALTRVVDNNLVKVFSWYDNEWGYTAMLVKHVATVAKLI
ncbi:MAG: type I glyceraldehyde-3-phosphate dehydrogenase [Minisyncoccia bacterium]|jgi:glyceraldehyde 3-phosphate dehydrogenase